MSASIIFASSLFISTVGSKEWPKVYFGIQLFVVSFLFINLLVKRKNSYFSYPLMNILALLFAVLLYYGQTNSLYIYAYAIVILATDLIGKIISNTVIASMFTTFLYKEISQKIVSMELAGKIVGTLFIGFLSHYNHTEYYYYFAWFFIMANLVTFSLIVRVSLNKYSAEDAIQKTESVFKELKVAFKYIRSNLHIYGTLLIVVWSQIVKFSVDLLRNHSLEHLFQGMNDIGKFLSIIHLIIVFMTLIFQKFIGIKLVRKSSPALLFTILPLGIILLSISALLASPYWIVIFMSIFFLIINKSIQTPITRQCLFTASKQIRDRVYFLANVIVSVLIFSFSCVITYYKDSLGITELLIILISISVLIFAVITKLDTSYIRTLWKNFKEQFKDQSLINLDATDDPYGNIFCKEILYEELAEFSDTSIKSDEEQHSNSTNLSSFYSKVQGRDKLFNQNREEFYHLLMSESIDSISSTSLLVYGYILAKKEETLHFVVSCHKELLSSKDPERIICGIRTMAQINIPEFASIIKHFTSHSDESVSAWAIKTTIANSLLREIYNSNLPSVYIRKYHNFVFNTLDDMDYELEKRVAELPTINRKDILKSLIDILYNKRFKENHLDVIWSYDTKNNLVNFEILIEKLLTEKLSDSKTLRYIMFNLGQHRKVKTAIDKHLNTIVGILTKSSFNVKNVVDNSHIELFLKVLFLVEWNHQVGSGHRFGIINSVEDFLTLNDNDRKIWSYLHYEYLKGTVHTQIRDMLNPTIIQS